MSVFDYFDITSLFLGILGTWFMSKSVIQMKTEDAIDMAAFWLDINDDSVVNSINERTNYKYGFRILFISFILQMISKVFSKYINYSVSKLWLQIIFLIISIIIGFLIYYINIMICNKKKDKLLIDYLKSKPFYKGNKLPDIEEAKRYFRYLDDSYNDKLPLDKQWEEFINKHNIN